MHSVYDCVEKHVDPDDSDEPLSINYADGHVDDDHESEGKSDGIHL